MEIIKYLINCKSSILYALEMINELDTQPLTLLVVDKGLHLVGTLTDGDIRRALLKGVSLDSSVSEALNRNYRVIKKSDVNYSQALRDLRKANIHLVPVVDEKGDVVEVINLCSNITHLPVDAVLMAGGKGERLRPLTEKTPKPLLKVGEKCIIDHNIDRLISYGIEHITVTVNYLKDQLIEHFETPRNGVKIDCVAEPKYLGTIGSIKFVDTFHNDTILVMNSDLFTNLDYEDFYLHFSLHDADMSVAAVPYTVSVPYGIMDLDGRRLRGMIEKPTYNYYANGGIYLIKRELLSLIPDGEFFNATDLIDKLISMGKNVIRFPINGTWIDIGNPQEYQKANELVKHLK